MMQMPCLTGPDAPDALEPRNRPLYVCTHEKVKRIRGERIFFPSLKYTHCSEYGRLK